MMYETLLRLFFALILLAFSSCTKEPENVAISSDGLEIRFDVQGEGDPTLVFIHGWCCDRTYWDAQVPHFSKKYKVVAIDLVGHGESDINRKVWSMEMLGKDVVAVIKQLGINNVVLIGHSMVGSVVLDAAQMIPERIVGLVGVDTFGRIRGPMPQDEIEKSLVRYQTNFSDSIAALVRRVMFTPNSDPVLIEKIASDMAAAPPEVGLSELIELFKYDFVSAVQQIEVPIRCINANRNEKNVKEAQQYTHSYDVVAMSNVGHFVMMEDPETFIRLLEEIIQEFKN